LNEGFPADAIVVSGNTVIDGLLRVARDVTEPGPLKRVLDKNFSWIDASKRTILVTGHRRESFGSGLAGVCTALASIGKRGDAQILYPVHLNPNVRGPVFERLAGAPNVFLIDPLSYPEFVYLMTRSYLILTDSGGIQEEAPSLRKPVLVMRDTSERIEAIEAGVARLVTTEPDLIIAGVEELLDSRRTYEAMSTGANPFGDGQASKRIVKDLLACGREAPTTGRASPAHCIAESAEFDFAG
jgi:UDP-N-acetylglucosamine 2-epimerase (non-hydrolysing)